MTIQVGDALLFVPSHRMGGEQRLETVVRMTKLWAHTDRGGKFQPKEMSARYGKYYRSIEEYDADTRRRWAWTRIIRLLFKSRWCCPDDVSAEDIYEAACLLKLNIIDEGARA